MLRYRLNTADGKRKENTLRVGLPTEKAAWHEVDRLGLLSRRALMASGWAACKPGAHHFAFRCISRTTKAERILFARQP